ncbi:MAG: hypothetical protein OHK93_007401 [Ramalina farinacea]|uniref:Uncharacterized protein n=1 Tax=Ramalina farinacea TaxID=258253 RepID=A0AA43QKE5_9LECA|nr:hypothetical protein [Ramalina farinacea]
MAMLADVLAPYNMLKTFNLEIWDIWDPEKLHNVLTKLAGAPSRTAINIQVVQHLWMWEPHRSPGPDRLERSIMEWNQTSERQWVKTNFELTAEQRGKEPWDRLWKRESQGFVDLDKQPSLPLRLSTTTPGADNFMASTDSHLCIVE